MTKFPVYMQVVFKHRLSMLTNKRDNTKAMMIQYTKHLIDFRLCEEAKLRAGHYHLVFAHPEFLISTKYGRELLLSENDQKIVVGIVIDEAHCINH